MRPLALLPLAVTWAACGPSFQVIYEGDQKFEHCYAVDDNPSVPMPDKAACWREWMHGYTYGQTRNRVEYAAMRARALSRVSLPTDEAMMEAAPGQSTQLSVAAPAPTNAFAPPPKTMSDPDASAGAPSPAPSVVFVSPPPPAPSAPPAANCQDDCSRAWQECPGKGEGADAKVACTKAYKTCMRACFK